MNQGKKRQTIRAMQVIAVLKNMKQRKAAYFAVVLMPTTFTIEVCCKLETSGDKSRLYKIEEDLQAYAFYNIVVHFIII